MSDHSYVRDRLLKAHGPDETGAWHIYGEDPNCDLGGPHHEPYLGVVEGKYSEVVEHALKMPHFFTWGGGGRIDKAMIEKITYAEPPKPTKKQLRAEKKRLQKRIQEIDAELNG